MNTTGDKSAFNYPKVRVRLRCACCGEYTTSWANNYHEELALPVLLANHRGRELCSSGHTHEVQYVETGEIRTVAHV